MLVYFTDGPLKNTWREVKDGLPFLSCAVPNPDYSYILPGDEHLVIDRITYDFISAVDTDGFKFKLGYSEERPVIRNLLRERERDGR